MTVANDQVKVMSVTNQNVVGGEDMDGSDVVSATGEFFFWTRFRLSL